MKDKPLQICSAKLHYYIIWRNAIDYWLPYSGYIIDKAFNLMIQQNHCNLSIFKLNINNHIQYKK